MSEKEIKLGNYRTSHGVCTCIYWEGTKRVHTLTLDPPLTVRSLPLSETKFITPLFKSGGPYPFKRFLKFYRRAGKRFGINDSAKKLLKEAAKQSI